MEFSVRDRGWYDGCQGCWTRRASNRSYGYVETRDARQTPTIVDRGADALVAAGRIGEATTAALKAGARQRIAEGRLFGHVAYASLVARLPN